MRCELHFVASESSGEVSAELRRDDGAHCLMVFAHGAGAAELTDPTRPAQWTKGAEAVPEGSQTPSAAERTRMPKASRMP